MKTFGAFPVNFLEHTVLRSSAINVETFLVLESLKYQRIEDETNEYVNI